MDSVGHFKIRQVSYHFIVGPRNTGSKTALVIGLLWVSWWLSQNGHLNAKGITDSSEIQLGNYSGGKKGIRPIFPNPETFPLPHPSHSNLEHSFPWINKWTLWFKLRRLCYLQYLVFCIREIPRDLLGCCNERFSSKDIQLLRKLLRWFYSKCFWHNNICKPDRKSVV